MKTKRLFAVLMAFLVLVFTPHAAISQVVRPGATTLLLYNASNADVTVMVTVQGPPPCLSPGGGPVQCVFQDGCAVGSVAPIHYINLTLRGRPTPLQQFGAPTKGWFILKRGHRAQLINMGVNQITKLPSSCLAGMNIGFNQQPNACPDFGGPGTQFPDTRVGPTYNTPAVPNPPLPNGANAFECSLNLPGTVNGATSVGSTPVPTGENIDISCVNGANSNIKVQVTPPAGGPYWQTNMGTRGGGLKTFTTTTFFQNSWVDVTNECDANCVDPRTGLARPGVYPFGCTQCNSFPDPAPPCGGKQFCAARNGLAPNTGCLFTRAPLGNQQNSTATGVQKFGGTILVTYMGPLSPPGTCPPGTKQ